MKSLMKQDIPVLRAVRRSRTLSLVAISLLALTVSVPAFATNLVVNGGFESTTNGPNFQFDRNTQAIGWTSDNSGHNAYNFIFAAGAADTVGGTGQFGNLKLWGPGTGSNNGLPASSPDGGNFVGADGAYQNGAISQTINGLVVGHTYDVSFWWAGAQQSGFTGATTEQWKVSLGSDVQYTVVLNNANHGFTGWQQDTLTYTATSTSEVLSFFAIGTPNGVPPFVLLDGVTMFDTTTPTPEPGTLALMASGLTGLVGIARRYGMKK